MSTASFHIGIALAVAFAAHVAVLVQVVPKDPGALEAGAAGEDVFTVEAVSGAMAQLVEEWQRSPNVQDAQVQELPEQIQDVAAPLAEARVVPKVPRPDTPMLLLPTPEAELTPDLFEKQLDQGSVKVAQSVASPLPLETELEAGLDLIALTPTPPQRSAAQVRPALPVAEMRVTTASIAPPVLIQQPGADTQRPIARPVPVRASAPAASRAAQRARGSEADELQSASANAASLLADWGAAIRGRVERNKKYPASASGVSGRTVLQLSISATGQLARIALLQSSGNAAIDKAAIGAVRRAGRFPAAPKGMRGGEHVFRLALAFGG